MSCVTGETSMLIVVVISGGDFNVDMDLVLSSTAHLYSVLRTFLNENKMPRCDQLFSSSVNYERVAE